MKLVGPCFVLCFVQQAVCSMMPSATVISPLFYADWFRFQLHKMSAEHGLVLMGRLKRQAVQSWYPVQGRVCLFRCFDDFEARMRQIDSSVPNAQFHSQFYDRRVVTSVCDAYRTVYYCMSSCQHAHPRLPPVGEFLMGPLNFMCIDYYDVLQRALPCYHNTNATVAEQCSGKCKGEASIAEIIYINDPHSYSDTQAQKLVEKMCSFITCSLDCQKPIFERSCYSTVPGNFAADFFHSFFKQTLKLFKQFSDGGKAKLPAKCDRLSNPLLPGSPSDYLSEVTESHSHEHDDNNEGAVAEPEPSGEPSTTSTLSVTTTTAATTTLARTTTNLSPSLQYTTAGRDLQNTTTTPVYSSVQNTNEGNNRSHFERLIQQRVTVSPIFPDSQFGAGGFSGLQAIGGGESSGTRLFGFRFPSPSTADTRYSNSEFAGLAGCACREEMHKIEYELFHLQKMDKLINLQLEKMRFEIETLQLKLKDIRPIGFEALGPRMHLG